MATVTTATISDRTLAHVQKDMLRRALDELVWEKFGQMKQIPKQSTRTMTFRRYKSLTTSPTVLVESVTPNGQDVQVEDVTVTLQQIGGYINFSDVMQDTHTDPVLQEMTGLISEQPPQTVERMRSAELCSGTNVYFGNGLTRAGVNTPMTLKMHRAMVLGLKLQLARRFTKVLASTPDFNTEPIAASYIGVIHPNVLSDYRNIVGADGKAIFIPVEKYGSKMSVLPCEVGSFEGVRLVESTTLPVWLNAGGAKGSMRSAGGINADIHPVIYLGMDAFASVALKGPNAFMPIIRNPTPSDTDPLAQRGSIGWKGYTATALLNQMWLIRGEVAATA